MARTSNRHSYAKGLMIASQKLPETQPESPLSKTQRHAMDSRLVQAINEVMGDSTSQSQMIGTPVVAWGAGQVTKIRILDKAVTEAAGTGTPIPQLRGIARAKATMATVGGGTKAVGGGGIDGGLKSLRNNAIAVELAIFGISGAVTVARIAVRYRQLVVIDRQATAKAARVARESDEQGGVTPVIS